MNALGVIGMADRTACAAAMSEAPSRASSVSTRWTTVPGGLVDGGEIVLLAIKPSLWRPVFDSSPWLVSSAILSVALLSMGKAIPGLSVATTAQVVLLVGLTRLAVALLRWTTTWHLLTNRRILDVHGIRAPVIRSCLLVHIRNTYVNVAPLEKLASLGTITFVTDQPDDPPHVWRSVSEPDEVHLKIRRAIENAIDQYGM